MKRRKKLRWRERERIECMDNHETTEGIISRSMNNPIIEHPPVTAIFNYPEKGCDHEKEAAKHYLKLHKEYKLDHVSMGQSNTAIYLKDFEIGFNSVHFDFYENGKIIDIFKDARFNPYIRMIKSPMKSVMPPKSIRKSILDDAEQCICSDRNVQYGEPEDNFKAIAELWSVYLGKPISANDVGVMMALLKIARIKSSHDYKADSYIDAVGYIACAAQCAEKERTSK